MRVYFDCLMGIGLVVFVGIVAVAIGLGLYALLSDWAFRILGNKP